MDGNCDNCQKGKMCLKETHYWSNKKYENYCYNNGKKCVRVCYSYEKDPNISSGVVCRRETVIYEC